MASGLTTNVQSYLSCVDGLNVRIIDAGLVMTGADGRRIGGRYRLITTLTGPGCYPAAEHGVPKQAL